MKVIHVAISDEEKDLVTEAAKKWRSMSIDERQKLLTDNEWADLELSKWKFNILPTHLQIKFAKFLK